MMSARLQRAEQQVAAARAGGGPALQAALRERFAARRERVDESGMASPRGMVRVDRGLRQAARELTTSAVEVGVFFDLAGNELFRYRGEALALHYPDDDLPLGMSVLDQWHGAVHLHNHTSASGGFGPSPDDLIAACLAGLAESVVLAGWRDQWGLHRIRPAGDWPTRRHWASLTAAYDRALFRALTAQAGRHA
ncbi:MAG: hypothetical protein HYU66_06375, partial [Armatimonadetes bacterium]|nr:hypothetical protein [Armatimonadota bacterium]